MMKTHKHQNSVTTVIDLKTFSIIHHQGPKSIIIIDSHQIFDTHEKTIQNKDHASSSGKGISLRDKKTRNRIKFLIHLTCAEQVPSCW